MLNRKSACTGRAYLQSVGSTYLKTHTGCDILYHLVCRQGSVGSVGGETQGRELNTSSVSVGQKEASVSAELSNMDNLS